MVILKELTTVQMEEESRLYFNSNGSGVILRLTAGDVSFRSLEFQFYQALFKICDTSTLGHVSLHNPCLFELMRGTKLDLGLLKRLLSISTTEIYKSRLYSYNQQKCQLHQASLLPSSAAHTPSSDRFNGHLVTSGCHGKQHLYIPDTINFHQWLLLCKLIACVQQQLRLQTSSDATGGGFSSISDLGSPSQLNSPVDGDSDIDEVKLLNSVLDSHMSDVATGITDVTASLSSPSSQRQVTGTLNGIPISKIDQTTTEPKQSRRHKTEQINISAHNSSIAHFSLCSIHSLHIQSLGLPAPSLLRHPQMSAVGLQSQHPHSAGQSHSQKADFDTELPTFVVDIIGWEFSDSEESYQQQHVKFKLQCVANKRLPLCMPTVMTSDLLFDAVSGGGTSVGLSNKKLLATNLANALNTDLGGSDLAKSGSNTSLETTPKLDINRAAEGQFKDIDFEDSDTDMDEDTIHTDDSESGATSLKHSQHHSRGLQKHQQRVVVNLTPRTVAGHSLATSIDATPPTSARPLNPSAFNTNGINKVPRPADNEDEEDGGLLSDANSIGSTTTTIVYRRFSDFERLVEVLQSSYPGVVIPPLPPKVGPQWTHFNFNNKLSDVLLHQRCRDLKMFLDAVCAHRLLRCSFELRVFLEASTKGYRSFRELFPRFVRGEVG